MKRNLLTATTLLLAVCCSMRATAQTVEPAKYKDWSGYVLKNDLVRLHVVPEIGGRVIQFSLGEKEFFWVNPALHGKTSLETGLDEDGEWMNYGGDKLWPAPQGWDGEDQWPGPPDAVLDGQPHRAALARDRSGMRLTSRPDPRSGIQFTRRIRLHPNSTRVRFLAEMKNADDKPRRWGIWAHTQLDAGLPDSDQPNRKMRAWCPISPKSHFESGFDVIFGEKDNPSFVVDKERRLMQVNYLYRVGKIGLDSDAGWVATVDGRTGDVFVQSFHFESDAEYPGRSSVEFWHNGVGRIYAYNKWLEMIDDSAENPYVFESEILSPFARLEPGESYSWGYSWAACRIGGDFPVVDCNKAGVVSEPLAMRRDGNGMRVTGRFGVFSPGRVVLSSSDANGRPLGKTELDIDATPLEALVLDNIVELHEDTTRLTVHLIGADNRSGGWLDQTTLPQ